ncbi:gluconate 2-dehydrogenase subunit 3 family protein [Paraburkholderia sp. SIMBA_009]
MKSPGITPGRRAFLRGVAAAAPAAAVASAGVLAPVIKAAGASATTSSQPVYFNEAEWTTLCALTDRLIPADALGPGALEAGVPGFIDKQMMLPYGFGKLWYMQGPFVADAPPQMGYQLPYGPRDLYRKGLQELDAAVMQAHGKPFAQLDDATKDRVLTSLEHGQLPMGAIPGPVFFDQLLKNTREGYFSDPVHGGNKDMGAWKMINFPGARADYMDAVEQYGKPYRLPPVSIG